MLGFFIIGGIAGVLGLLISIVATVFWIWMLVDCIQNDKLSGGTRVLWAIVIFFFHCIGALLYFFIGRQK